MTVIEWILIFVGLYVIYLLVVAMEWNLLYGWYVIQNLYHLIGG